MGRGIYGAHATHGTGPLQSPAIQSGTNQRGCCAPRSPSDLTLSRPPHRYAPAPPAGSRLVGRHTAAPPAPPAGSRLVGRHTAAPPAPPAGSRLVGRHTAAPPAPPAGSRLVGRHTAALPQRAGLEGGEGVFHGGDEGIDVGVGVGGGDEVDLEGGGFEVNTAG